MRHKWHQGIDHCTCRRCGLQTSYSQMKRGTGRCSGEPGNYDRKKYYLGQSSKKKDRVGELKASRPSEDRATLASDLSAEGSLYRGVPGEGVGRA